MASSSILPDASVIQKNALQKTAIREYVANILKRMRDEIMMAKKQGHHELITTLPIQFEIPNMKNNVGQRVVWASVIKAFKEKNYRIGINPEKNKCTIRIVWISREDEAEVQEQMKLLAEHLDNSL